MNPKNILFVSFILGFIPYTQCLNILILTPFGYNSVRSLFWTLTEGILEKGHSVTILCPGDQKFLHKNLVHYQAPHSSLDGVDLFEIRAGSDLVGSWATIFPKIVKEMYSQEKIQNLWKNRNNFDIIIMNGAANEMAIPFLMDISIPFVLVAPAGIEPNQLSFLGNYVSPATLPFLNLPYSDYMSFKERLRNTILTMAYRYGYRKKVGQPLFNEMKEIFEDLDDYVEYFYKQSGTLVSRHYALDGSVPLLPNQVEIGCLTCKPAGSLPQDLKEWVEGSGPDGVVYFSLGSIQGSKIPKKYLNILIEAFGNLPHRVVMVGNHLEDFPTNVKAWKWIPQQDILGHNKVVAFITHCGMYSVYEAVYHGVPIIGIPITFNQPRMCARTAHRGEGVVLSWDDLTSEQLVSAIKNVTQDQSYKKLVMKSRQQFLAQPETSIERAIWWIEHIEEFGTQNLKYSGADLHLSQYLLMDVFLVIFIILTFVLFVTYFGLRQIFRKVIKPVVDKFIRPNIFTKEKLKGY